MEEAVDFVATEKCAAAGSHGYPGCAVGKGESESRTAQVVENYQAGLGQEACETEVAQLCVRFADEAYGLGTRIGTQGIANCVRVQFGSIRHRCCAHRIAAVSGISRQGVDRGSNRVADVAAEWRT